MDLPTRFAPAEVAAAPAPAPATAPTTSLPKLQRLPVTEGFRRHPQQQFLRPVKRIHEGPDVARFLVSQGYRDIGLFILQLAHALCPREGGGAVATPEPAALSEAAAGPKLAAISEAVATPEPAALSEAAAAPKLAAISEAVAGETSVPLPSKLLRRTAAANAGTTTVFTLQTPRQDPPSVQRLQKLLERVAGFMDEAPPDPGPRRFGNISFRTWHRLLSERVDGLLREFVCLDEAPGPEAETATALDEIKAYFLGSFGSAQRLDYGTGHELSFLAFLGCLWKVGVFADGDAGPDGEAVERSIVLGVMEPYLRVVRRLILTYTLEPAGSHGVWGLDDHSFLPYIFGSAQLTRPLRHSSSGEPLPQEGSAPRAPKPADVLKPATVAVQRQLNMYFSAIGFIDDVKRGPFWEHSPILYDISGIKDGWGKINKGMLKMYHAEVLSKFPVVQHFPFGSLFSWDVDPAAAAPSPSVHMANQPLADAAGRTFSQPPPPPPSMGTAPWAPTARVPAGLPPPQARPGAPGVASGQHASGTTAAQAGLTRAPWAK